MLQIQNALGILSSQVPTGNLVWVDQINGVDKLAIRGRLTIPFKTLAAARDAAKAGDTIMVLPGTYTDSDLLRNGINWHFLPGSSVSASGTIFNSGGGTPIASVTGYGSFDTSSGNAVNISSGAVRIEAKNMSAGGNDIIVLSGGGAIIHCDILDSSTGYLVNVSGGGHRITAHRLRSSSSEPVYISGGSLILTAYEIYAENTVAIRHNNTGASLTVRHARIISLSDEAIHVVLVPTADNGLILSNCLLIGGGSHSIDAADTTPVQLLGGCCATQEVELFNISKIGTLTVAASFT